MSDMTTSRGQRVGDRLAQSWWLDLIAVAIIAAVCHHQVNAGTGIDLFGRLKLMDRVAAYNSLGSILTFFAGFTSLGFATYVGLKGKAIQQIKRIAGAQILRMWISLVACTWLASLTVWLCGLLELGLAAPGTWPRWIVTAALILILLQLVRVIWLLAQLIGADEVETMTARPTSRTPITVTRTTARVSRN